MQQHFHQVEFDRRAGRLHHETIGAADVFENLEIDLAVGEALEFDLAQFQPELPAHLLRQRRVGAAGEDLDAVGVHRAYRLRGGHRSPFV